jgi:hypothetical protein
MNTADLIFYASIAAPLLLGAYGLIGKYFGTDPDELEDA